MDVLQFVLYVSPQLDARLGRNNLIKDLVGEMKEVSALEGEG